MVSSVPRETLTPTQSRMTSMRRLIVTTTVSVLLGCSTAWAQVTVGTGAPVPLGITSPLGMGPGASVGVTGIPLGATEMATPGVSPTAAGTAALGSMTAGTCSSIGASAQPTTSDPGNSSPELQWQARAARRAECRRRLLCSIVQAYRELLLAHVPAAPPHPLTREHRPRRLATVRNFALAVLAFPWDRPNLEPAALVHCLTPCKALSPRQAAFRVRRPGSHLRQEHQRLQHQRLRVAAEGCARPRNHANANENARSNHSGDRRRRRGLGVPTKRP